MTLAVVLGTSAAAQARVTVGFNFGDVGIGYSDGYYDRGQRWHNWRRHDDMTYWRRSHLRDYHDWRHDDSRHR
jgi:hypothetical protein